MKTMWRACALIDGDALRSAQEAQDALAAQRIIRRALFSAGSAQE
jgi:xylose isomerase